MTTEELSKEHTDVVFIHIDVDKLPDLEDGKDVRVSLFPHEISTRLLIPFALQGVPTFKFFKAGSMISTFSGASKDKLLQTITSNK